MADAVSTDQPTVLIAEDDPALADVLRMAFTRQGCQVTVCRNGQQALQAAQQSAFDVVCSDYQMPGLNGEQLLSGVRASGESQQAVCIFCSAKSYELDCEQMSQDLNLQAVFYKPFSLAEIVTEAMNGLSQRALV